MSDSQFHSQIDWQAIDSLRDQFQCLDFAPPGTEGMAIQIERQPIVPVHLNGDGPLWMVFETGHGGYFLTEDVAPRFGLVPDSRRMVHLDSFAMGDARWRGLRCGLDNTSSLSKLMHRQIDGLLGNLFWIIQRVTPTLDYPNRRLFLAPDGKGRPLASEPNSVPMEIVGYTPFVDAMVNGKGPFRFHVDTGAAFCLLSKSTAEALKVDLGGPCRLRGTQIDDPAHHASVDSLCVGHAEVNDLPVRVSMERLLVEKNVQSRVDGTLGTTFFKHFQVTFDFARERLALRGVDPR